jgi:hypothetical protein
VLGDRHVGPGPGQHRLLLDQPHLVGQRQRVVRAHLRAEAVLERGDDAAAVGVVLGVRAGHQQQVQRQPQRVAADLDVALLEHVQQRDLDPLGQVGQLVDAEDPPVGARHQAVVHGLRVAQRAALRHLDRVDVADQVAHRGVRRGELLAVPVAAVLPRHRRGVAVLGDQPLALRADRGVRVLVQLGAGQHRGPLVEQAGQRADQPGLALAPLAEQHQVVTGEQRPLDLRQHRVVEAEDAGEGGLPGGEPGEQVVAHLGLDRLVHVAAGAQLAERRGGGGRGSGDGARHGPTVRPAGRDGETCGRPPAGAGGVRG